MMYSIVETDSDVATYKLTRLKANSKYEVKIVAVGMKGAKSDASIATEFVKGKRKHL